MAFFGLFGSKNKKEDDDDLIKSILAGPGNISDSTTRNEDSYSSKYAYNSATDSIDNIIKNILTNDTKTKTNYDDNVIDPNLDENSLINRILQEQAQIEAQRAAEQRKREEEVKLKVQQEARANYYKDNKETIIKNRTSELIYNWTPEKGISNWDYKDLSSNDLKSRLGIEDLEVNTYLSSEDNTSYQKQRDYAKNAPKLGYTDRENPFMDANILNPEENTELIINRQKSAYENDFEEFNEALEKGQVKRANNSLERIIARRYGYSMNDGLWASIDNMLTGRDDRDFNKLQNKFDDNLKKLTEINESIKNGDDINVLAALNAEKDRLELDNKLIQYHRLLHIEAQNQMVAEYDSANQNIIQPWENLSNYDLDTSNLLTTIASSFNYIVQTAGAVANTFGGGLDTAALMLRDDQDEDKGLIFEAGDIKLQIDLATVLDAVTYLEPVTRTMRVVADMYTPAASVITPYALNKLGMEEKAVLIEDGVAPSGWNALGAVGYATAGYLTSKVFKGMGDRLFGNQMLDFHKSVGRQMVTNIFKEASTELVEEFVQTYSESMMYTEGFGYNDFTDKKLFADSVSAGLSAFVIAGGLSAGSTVVNGIYNNNVIGDGMLLRTDTSDSYKKLVDHSIVDGKTNVSFDNDTDTFNYIRNRLDNGEVITISSPDSLNYENSPSGMNQGSIVDISDIKSNNQITLSDLYTNNNATLVIVPSHQMANYISDLNPNANIVVVDTKSKTYLSDLNSVIQTQSKVNLAPIKTDNHIEPNTKVDKSLVSNLKNTVDNTINNLKTTINKTVDDVKLKVEDTEAPSKTIINANDYNKTPNQMANKVKVESVKVMNDADMSTAKKQTAFKQLSKDIASDLKTDSFESRAYIKSQAGNPVLFNKKGNNLYEATNKITGEGDMLTMVKSNGKMINGNLDTSLNLDKNIVTTVNNLIDNLKLKGDYITEKSTHRDIGNLINANRNVAGELLQSLGYDALFSYDFDKTKADNKSKGNETLTLITAHDNLDNFNLEKALENANEAINQIMNEVKTDESDILVIKNVNKSNTATFDDFTNSQVEVKPKDMMKVDNNGNIDIGDGKTIDSEYYTPEYNAIIDNTTFGKKPKDKKALKFTFNNLQALITDWYAPIMQHVKHKGTVVDHDVLIALDNTYNVDSVYRNHVKYGQRSFDGQTETGKSVEAIFNQLKGSNKKETKANNNKFQEMMYLYLHEERLRHGAEAIYEGVPGDVAVKRANDILNDNPKFKLVMDDIKQLNSNSLDYLLDSGLINAVQHSDLKNKYQYYIPIYSNNPSDFVELGTPEWFNKAKQHNTLKETTLASLNIENLQDAIKSKLYMEIKAGYKNKLMQAIANSTNVADIKTKKEIVIPNKAGIDSKSDKLVSKYGQYFDEFNKNIVKGHDGEPVYISRHTSQPNEVEYINTYKQDDLDNYGWWYANSPTRGDYYNSNESDKFINDLFDKSTVKMIKDKKGAFATISEKYLTPPSSEEITDGGRYNYIEGHLTGKIFDISLDGDDLPFDVSNSSEIDTKDKVRALEQKRRDTVTRIYTNLKNKYDKDNKYSLDDFRKYIPLVDALKLDGYTGVVGDYNNGTKEIVIFDESKFMPKNEYERLSSEKAGVTEKDIKNNPIVEKLKNSKVRDDDGELKVVYHGTDTDFDVFDKNKIGSNYSETPDGFFFTDDDRVAEFYASIKGSDGSVIETPNVIKAYLNFEKPLIVTEYDYNTYNTHYSSPIDHFDDYSSTILNEYYYGDYDSIIVKGDDSNLYVAFDSNQIYNINDKSNNIDTDSETNAYSGNTGQLIYFDNGEVKQFMTTKEIAESVDGGYRSTNIDKAFNLPVLKQFKWINKRVKSRMLTGWDPMFQGANLIRDYLDTAFINTNYNPVSFTKNYLRAFGNVARGSQMYYDFASAGIVDLGPKNSIHRLIHNFEAMPKFAEYLTALDAGKSRQDAIIEARSANINMHRGGSLVKQLNNNGVIFLNMAVQGADKAVGSGIRLVRGANTPKGFVKLVTILGAAAAPGVINSLLNEDDEDYKKIPHYLKNNYFFIKGSDGQFIRIPKGRVTAFVDTLFRYASGISSENTPKDYVDSIADVVKNSILPIEISGSFPLYSEYQGLIGNETFTGGEIWSENDSEEVKREKQFKYFVHNYTGRFGKTLIAAIDDDASTDVYSSINNFHFDSTRYNKNLSTVYDLKSYYENKDNVKTFEDQIKKKYIDTQMSNLNQNIRATINKGRDAGLSVQELRPWYQASDAITNDIIRNINNYVLDINGDGSYTIYFDDLVFDYKLNKHGEWKFTKRK